MCFVEVKNEKALQRSDKSSYEKGVRHAKWEQEEHSCVRRKSVEVDEVGEE